MIKNNAFCIFYNLNIKMIILMLFYLNIIIYMLDEETIEKLAQVFERTQNLTKSN